jgi:hypothetical protein
VKRTEDCFLFFTYLDVKDVSVHRPVQNTFEGFTVQDPASLLLQEPSLSNRCRAHRSWFSYVPFFFFLLLLLLNVCSDERV